MARTTVVTKDRRLRAKDLKRDPMRDAYEKLSDKVEQNREQIKKVTLSILGVILLVGLIYYFTAHRSAAAEAALAGAFEIYNAPVGETNTTKAPVFFTSDDDKYKHAAQAFLNVANTYSHRYGDEARYFAGLCQLKFDSKTGLATLESLSHEDSATGRLSAFALAEQDKQDGQYDKAIQLYQGLISKPGELPIPIAEVKLSLADSYRLQGNKDEASKIYFELASAGRKAANDAAAAKTKDPATKVQGDPTPSVTRDAIQRLTEIDPRKVDQLPEEAPSNPFGGMSFGG